MPCPISPARASARPRSPPSAGRPTSRRRTPPDAGSGHRHLVPDRSIRPGSLALRLREHARAAAAADGEEHEDDVPAEVSLADLADDARRERTGDTPHVAAAD